MARNSFGHGMLVSNCMLVVSMVTFSVLVLGKGFLGTKYMHFDHVYFFAMNRLHPSLIVTMESREFHQHCKFLYKFKNRILRRIVFKQPLGTAT